MLAGSTSGPIRRACSTAATTAQPGIRSTAAPPSSMSGFFFDTNRSRIVVSTYGRGLWQIFAVNVPARYVVCSSPCRRYGGGDSWVAGAGSLLGDALRMQPARPECRRKASRELAGVAVVRFHRGWRHSIRRRGAIGVSPTGIRHRRSGCGLLVVHNPRQCSALWKRVHRHRGRGKGGTGSEQMVVLLDAPGSYTASRTTLAKKGSLLLGDDVPVTLTVRDVSGKKVVGGAAVYLEFSQHQARGYADVDGVALNGKPQRFLTGPDGTITLHYRAGHPRSGRDTILMASRKSAPGLHLGCPMPGRDEVAPVIRCLLERPDADLNPNAGKWSERG